MCFNINSYQKALEESEKKFQSTQGRLEEFAALKGKLSDMEGANKDLEASKEVYHLRYYV